MDESPGRPSEPWLGVGCAVVLVFLAFVIGNVVAFTFAWSVTHGSATRGPTVSQFEYQVGVVWRLLLPMVLATAVAGLIVHRSVRRITVWTGIILTVALPLLAYIWASLTPVR